MAQLSKNRKVIFLVVVLFLAIGFLFALKVTAAKDLEVNWPPAPGGVELTPTSTLVNFVDYAYRWGMLLGGLAAFFALILAGFNYLTSVGDPAKMRDARDRIIAAVLGLILLFSSFIILNTLNPELTTLRAPTTTIPGVDADFWKGLEWDKPCEWVDVYLEKNYGGDLHLRYSAEAPWCCPRAADVGWLTNRLCRAGMFGGKWPDCKPAAGDPIVGSWPLDTCVSLGSGGFLWLFASETPVGSVKIKGGCQLNLYEENTCKGNFTALGKSAPSLKWIALEHVRGALATDISPPIPPIAQNVGTTNPWQLIGPLSFMQIVGRADSLGKADVGYIFFEWGKDPLYLNRRLPTNPASDTEVYSDGSILSKRIISLERRKVFYWRTVVRTEAGISFASTASFTVPWK